MFICCIIKNILKHIISVSAAFFNFLIYYFRFFGFLPVVTITLKRVPNTQFKNLAVLQQFRVFCQELLVI